MTEATSPETKETESSENDDVIKIDKEGWFTETKRDRYKNQLKMELGNVYIIELLEEPAAVFTRFGHKSAVFTVKCDGAVYSWFPGCDFKNKAIELQRKRGGSLKGVTLRVVCLRKQSATGKRLAYIYDVSEVCEPSATANETS